MAPDHTISSSEPLPPPVHPLKVVRYAKWGGYSPRQWAVSIAKAEWPTDATCLKAGDRGSVWRVTLTPQKRELDCIVKVEPCSKLTDQARIALRISRFHRQWAGAEMLHKHTVLTGRPKAILLGAKGKDRRVALLLDALPGRTVLEHAADPQTTFATESRVATALGQNLALMKSKGVVNRDHKPSNLIACPLDPDHPDGPFMIGVIDTMGVDRSLRGRGDASLWWLFACLVIEPTGIGQPPRQALCMRVVRNTFTALHPKKSLAKPKHRAAWKAWRNGVWAQVRSLVDVHGDPTPKDNPLMEARA